ncbi:hypothetical protein GMES_1791 [Paraglaciecola mesophila KMM 241]|uniref:Uncharacterized protein n=1 Tax=Paraglaciecola mesophila KMM 241 TaxID=1128912 RepID=K6Z0Z8_9ALTE|nr:hypothetical protein GMES_1791 [Paraglaciecola mesophila KMM 241]
MFINTLQKLSMLGEIEAESKDPEIIRPIFVVDALGVLVY